MSNKCPPGFEDDTWFITPSQALYGIASTDCTVHVLALRILSHILSGVLTISFILTTVRGIIELSRPKQKRNKNICIMALLSIWSIPFFLAILYLRGRVSVGVNFSLYGLGLVPYMISVRYFIHNLISSIPNVFGNNKQKGRIFSKDRMIRGNIIISNIFISIVGIVWGIVLPFQKEEKNLIICYQIGCFCLFAFTINIFIISWKSLSIVIDMIDSVLSYDNERQSTSSKQSNFVVASYDELKAMRNKFAFVKKLNVSSLIFGLLWIVHLIIVPFYWYIVIFHINGVASFYVAAIYLYPIKLDWLNECFSTKCGKMKRSTKTTTNTILSSDFKANAIVEPHTILITATGTIIHHEPSSQTDDGTPTAIKPPTDEYILAATSNNLINDLQ